MLTPMITVQQETSHYLGKPYTECINETDYNELLCKNKKRIENKNHKNTWYGV